MCEREIGQITLTRTSNNTDDTCKRDKLNVDKSNESAKDML